MYMLHVYYSTMYVYHHPDLVSSAFYAIPMFHFPIFLCLIGIYYLFYLSVYDVFIIISVVLYAINITHDFK